jgi:hypothetical protein
LKSIPFMLTELPAEACNVVKLHGKNGSNFSRSSLACEIFAPLVATFTFCKVSR